MDYYKLLKIAECICEPIPAGSRLLVHSDERYDYVLERTKDGYHKFFFRKGKYVWPLDIRQYLIDEFHLSQLSESMVSYLDL